MIGMAMLPDCQGLARQSSLRSGIWQLSLFRLKMPIDVLKKEKLDYRVEILSRAAEAYLAAMW
jgi:hypothetical protein